MSDKTAEIVLGGPALEDARRVINWAIRLSAGGLECSDLREFGEGLARLGARARLGEHLGEPGEPAGLAKAIGDDDVEVLVEAAETLADFAAWSDGLDEDSLEDPDLIAHQEAQIEAAWRTLLLCEPPRRPA